MRELNAIETLTVSGNGSVGLALFATAIISGGAVAYVFGGSEILGLYCLSCVFAVFPTMLFLA